MSRYSPKSLLVRCGFILAGILGAAFGCACFLLADLGADPVTAFVQGLGASLNTTPGVGTNILNITAFAALLLVNRRLIHIGTALYTLLLGLFVDLFSGLVGGLLGESPGMALRVATIVVGTLAIAVGLGLYQAAELGIGPTDGINQTIVQRTGIPYRWERMGFDLVMVAAGWLLGGTIWFGTILGVVGVGPVMAPTLEWGKRRIAAILGNTGDGTDTASQDHRS